jgi:hypothetical protein
LKTEYDVLMSITLAKYDVKTWKYSAENNIKMVLRKVGVHYVNIVKLVKHEF